jgi:hypothetical protein
VLGEQDDVLAAVAESGERERDHGETMVQIVPKVPGADGRPEIGVRGADDPGVSRLGPRTAETANGVLLDGLEQLGLQGHGNHCDFVQEDTPAVCRLELLEIAGGQSVTLKSGQSGSLPPRTVHDDRNASQTAPLKFLVFHVVKKGDPLTVPVQ